MAGLPVVGRRAAVTSTSSQPVGSTNPVSSSNAKSSAAPAAVIPFVRAAFPKTQFAFSVQGQMTTGQVPLQTQEIPAAGFMRRIRLIVSAATTGNAATTVFAADAPFSALAYIAVNNAAGENIFVPLTGYQVAMINKWFCIGDSTPWNDPRRDAQYVVTAGAGATGGSFTFAFDLPFEIDPRDALAALGNGAANKAYTVLLQLAPSSAVYTTAPTTLPIVTVTALQYFWSEPNAMTTSGAQQATAPIANGSVGLIKFQSFPITAADLTLKLNNVGNILRTALFTLRNSSGVRVGGVGNWPALTQISINDDPKLYLPEGQWRSDMAQDFGMDQSAGTVFDVAGALDTGVYTLGSYTLNPGGPAGCSAPRNGWLPLSDAAKFLIRGTSFGVAGTLEVITHEVKVPSAAALYTPQVG